MCFERSSTLSPLLNLHLLLLLICLQLEPHVNCILRLLEPLVDKSLP